MKGSKALITGATSGIGQAVARLFAQRGIHLILTGRNLVELQRLQVELQEYVEVQILQADLSLKEGRSKVVKLLHTLVPEIIINNAGFSLYGEALTYSTEEQLEILEVNGKAVLEITIEAARALASTRKEGIILNVSSAAAFQVMPNSSVYAASKALVNNFSEAFDLEFRRYGIRVLAICPGVVETNFQSRAGGTNYKQQWGVMTPSYVAEQIGDQVENQIPILIIDWKVRLLTRLFSLVPKRWRASVLEKIMSKRIKPRKLVEINQ